MKACIYARYSSDLQSDASIEDQVRLCRMRIEREGWELDQTYTDRAQSAASRFRPGYQKLLEDVRKGQFDIVVAEALDRLSRDQEDVAALYKQLSFAGIKLITIAEGEINELHVGLKGTMNALFLKDLADKVRRGLHGRIAAGRSGGGISFGYDVVREHDARGEPIHGGRSINAGQAEIVRRIFREFAAGRGPRRIAKQLNAERIPGPGGKPWGDTTIRGHATRHTGILRNELYIGLMVWNRQRYIKDPVSGKRQARMNPPEQWVTQPLSELRIVDQALWDAVAARLDGIRQSPMVEKARGTRFWEQRRPQHLLTGLTRCGVCGSPLAAVGKNYLACGAAHRHGTCSNRRSIPRPALETLVLDALKHQLMHPDAVKAFIEAYVTEINRQSKHDAVARQQKQKELAEVSRKIDGMLEAIAEGFRSPGLQQKLTAFEETKRQLEQELSGAAPPAPVLHPNLAELYRRRVAELQDAIADPHCRDEALGLIRGLVEAVVLHPTEAGFEIELVGEIANMVALAAGADGKNSKAARVGAAVDGAFRRSVKVVAGVGFEPTTFRL